MNAPSIDNMLVVPPGHSDTNLFIRSIPEFVTDDQLEEALSVFGPLESKKVMRDIHTGRSMEKAFARFSDAEAAREAMRSILEDGLFDARPRVEWARQQYDETISATERKQKKKLFMRNIPGDVTEDDVRALAEQYGEVESVTLRRDTQPSRSVARGGSVSINDLLIAFILFAHEGCAAEACEKIYRTFPFVSCGNTPILTKLAETKKERSGRRGPFQNQAHRNGMVIRRQGHVPPTVCSGESSCSEQMYYSSGSDRGFDDCGTKESNTPFSECSENSMMNSGDRSASEGMSPSGLSVCGNMSVPLSSEGGYTPPGRGWNASMQQNHRQYQNYSFESGNGGYEEGGSEGVGCPSSRHPLCLPFNPPSPQHYPSRPPHCSPYKQQVLPSGASPLPFNHSMDSRQRFQHGGQYPPPTEPQRFPPNSQAPSSPRSHAFPSPTNVMHQDCTTPMMTMGSAEVSEYSHYYSSSSSSRVQHQASQWPVNTAYQRPSYSGHEKQFPQQSKDADTTMCESVTSTSAMSVKSSSAWSTDSKRSDTYRHNPYSFD